MNWKLRPGRLAAAIAVAVAVGACGSTSSPTTSKGTITVAGFNSAESSILAQIYGQALSHDGYTVNYKPNLGNRDVVSNAIESGQVDLYLGYAATDLEFYNKGAGEATGDAADTTIKLNIHIGPLGLVALNPSPAAHQNAFAVTQATATKYTVAKLSDLAPIGNQLILGGPPDCPKQPYCLLGLENLYGIHFKDFKALDAGGPLTLAALANGSIQVGLVVSSDGDLNSLSLVVLEDDKHLENADNVVPILRQAIASDEVKMVLNAISSKLTTADLIGLNAQVGLQNMGADAVAKAWLQQHNYSS